MVGSPQQFGDVNQVYGFALGATTWAKAYIEQLLATSGSFVVPPINPNFPTIPTPPKPVTPNLPTFEQIVWNVPSPPVPFSEGLDISGLLPGPFQGIAPTLTFPGAPAGFTEASPTSPSVNLTFDYPTLTLTLPAPPSLLTLNVQKFDGITMPVAPDDPSELTAVAPTIVTYTPGAQYTSDLLTTLKAKLQSRLSGNDTGLPPEVEEAIWNRARDRVARAARDRLDALNQMEDLGYSVAPGAFVDARTKLLTEMQAEEAANAREIMIKQAELHLQNISQATDSAVQLEGQLINYVNQIEQRSFESCKYQTEAAIAIYNAKVQGYTAYLEAFKTKAAIYEAKIRAELSKVDAYKAEVDAELAKAQINTALVQQYDTQIRAALANVEVYKAELGAIQTKAEIEKTKVEVFGEQIKAYVGRISAYTANVEAYKAAVQAEGTKQEAFRSSVQAYSAQVEAAVKSAEALIEQFKGKLAAKTAEYEGYKAVVSAESAHAQAIAAINQTIAEAFKAEVGADSAYNEILTKQWQAAIDENERVAEVAINTAKMNAELMITTRQMAAEAAKVGAQVYAQLAAAAINATHWSSSVSTSESDSTSSSQSISESTNYNYSASV